MNRISPETRARRKELVTEFDNEKLNRELLTADDLEQGEQRHDLLHLLAAARPDLAQGGEIVPFLDDARRGEEFRAVAIRQRGSGLLVAAMWSERLNLDKHIPGDEAQQRFSDGIARLNASDLANEAHYASNAAVHPAHRKRHMARRAFAAALGDPAVFPKETAVFYRRSVDNLAGEKVEEAIGAELVFKDKNRRGIDRHLNMIIASPEVA